MTKEFLVMVVVMDICMFFLGIAILYLINLIFENAKRELIFRKSLSPKEYKKYMMHKSDMWWTGK